MRPDRDSSMVPPDGFEGEPIWMPKLAVKEPIIQNATFRNCTILGPAVLAPLQDCVFTGCSFPSADGFFWVVEPEQELFGVIGLISCQFIGCKFDLSTSLAMPDDLKAEFTGSING